MQGRERGAPTVRLAARIITAAIGLLFLVQGAGWIVSPASAAAGLGMPLLDGLARSTQVGDLAAFFVGIGVFCLLGAARGDARWTRAAALLFALAATLRTLAWAVTDAAFATSFIGIELGLAALLASAAAVFARESG